MEYCLFCDRRLSGFEHDICIDCQDAIDQEGRDIELEIRAEKTRQGIDHEQCGRCGRKLKTEKSKKDGFGPVCKKKWDAEKANDQLNADQQLGAAQDAGN